MKVTAIAPSNIAFVKYWGKKYAEKNLPMNPSISMTLDDSVSTTTTVEFLETFPEDVFLLNGYSVEGTKLKRVSSFLDIIRKKAGIELYAKVVTNNTFPTGAGIASSASGFAALAGAAAGAAGLKMTPRQLSSLARLGSGSAARSIFGGFVVWEKEAAMQIEKEDHWPELRDLVIVVVEKEKPIPSRVAMEYTVESSPLYQERLKMLPKRIDTVKKALRKKDFTTLAKEIMADSDNLHECLFDSTPQVVYLNDVSTAIKTAIRSLNKNKMIAAYTFDAGPNAHIITQEKNVESVKKVFVDIDYLEIIESGVGAGVRLSEEHLF